MDFALSEEQKLIVDTVRDFAENEISARGRSRARLFCASGSGR